VASTNLKSGMTNRYEQRMIQSNLQTLARMTNLEAFLQITSECGISHKWYPIAKDFFDNTSARSFEGIGELYYRGNSVLVEYVNDGTIAVLKNWGIDNRAVEWISPETRDPFNQKWVESIKETLIEYQPKN
jgi:hypothetical protein